MEPSAWDMPIKKDPNAAKIFTQQQKSAEKPGTAPFPCFIESADAVRKQGLNSNLFLRSKLPFLPNERQYFFSISRVLLAVENP
jgi:hypothetical protein